MSFHERLRLLRTERALSQAALARACKLYERTIRGLESGRVDPRISSLIALVNFFGVSADYLLGLSDVRKRR